MAKLPVGRAAYKVGVFTKASSSVIPKFSWINRAFLRPKLPIDRAAYKVGVAFARIILYYLRVCAT